MGVGNLHHRKASTPAPATTRRSPLHPQLPKGRLLVCGGVGLLGWAWVVAGAVDLLTTGDISEPPAAGEEGVTAAPEMGPVGVGGVAGGVVTGGRRSAP